MQNLKQRTPAQVAALHTLESSGMSVGITVLVAVVQYLSTSGLNLAGLGTVAGGAFVASMLMMYKSLIINQQILGGAKDTAAQGWQFIQAELRNISNALTGGKPVPAQVPAPTAPLAVDVQALARQLAQELMKTRAAPAPAPVPARPQIPDLPTQPQVDVVRTNTPPVPPGQPAPIYLPNPAVSATQLPAYPPNTSATGTVMYPTQPPYQG